MLEDWIWRREHREDCVAAFTLQECDCPPARRYVALQDVSVVVSLDDRTMDQVLDDLTEAAGHPRNSSALGLARWDLKAALRRAVREDVE